MFWAVTVGRAGPDRRTSVVDCEAHDLKCNTLIHLGEGFDENAERERARPMDDMDDERERLKHAQRING